MRWLTRVNRYHNPHGKERTCLGLTNPANGTDDNLALVLHILICLMALPEPLTLTCCSEDLIWITDLDLLGWPGCHWATDPDLSGCCLTCVTDLALWV